VSIKYTNNSEIMKKVTSSNYEILEDDPYKDIEKRDEAKEGARGKNPFTIPMVFNNIPAAVNYAMQPLKLFDAWYDAWCCTAFKPHIAGLYYLSDLIGETGTPWFNGTEFIRVHEFVKYTLGDGLDSEDIAGCAEADCLNAADWTYANRWRAASLIQQDSCMPKISAKTLLGVFGNAGQKVVSVVADMNEYVSFTVGGGTGFVWWNPDTVFLINDREFSSVLTNTIRKYYVVESELDHESGKATLKLISRTI